MLVIVGLGQQSYCCSLGQRLFLELETALHCPFAVSLLKVDLARFLWVWVIEKAELEVGRMLVSELHVKLFVTL